MAKSKKQKFELVGINPETGKKYWRIVSGGRGKEAQTTDITSQPPPNFETSSEANLVSEEGTPNRDQWRGYTAGRHATALEQAEERSRKNAEKITGKTEGE